MKVVCEVQEGKDDENRTRITVGCNLICYPDDAGTNTASLELINSLTAIDAHERQLFNELRGTVVSCQIFIRSQSLIAR